MATIPEALAIAIEHHQNGRLQPAEQIYREILQVEPNQPDALHLLGVIASQLGRPEIAVQFIRQAIRYNGNSALFHNNLGNALRELGKLEEAVACYHRAIKLQADYAEAHNNLGNALKDQGKLDDAVASYRKAMKLKADFAEPHYNTGVVLQSQGKFDDAIACYRRALQRKPDHALALNNLGSTLRSEGKLDDAIASYRRALELKPDFADAHYNLGVALDDQENLSEAIACFRRALELKPDFAEACNNLGNALKEQGKLDEAIASYRRALDLKPGFAEAHNNLGSTLQEQGKLDEAAACCRKALELRPEYAEAHCNLGSIFQKQEKLDEAVACCRRALELKPDYAEAYNILGNALKDQGMLDEAVACYRTAVERKPDFIDAHNNLVFAIQYCTGVTPAAVAEAHAAFNRCHALPLRGVLAPLENVGEHRSRLRVGFVSPDLGRHPVGYFLAGVLDNLDRDQFEIICYSDRVVKDDFTHRFQAAAGQWRDVFGTSDQRLAEQIREDRVDILFDLAGHTGHNRLLVFARKPAPIQVTWAGYVGTTGLTAMDYVLADRYEVPPGAEQYYQERVLRMPDGYVCYEPPLYAPAVKRLPALDCGHVTFGCFNNPAKITPQAIEVWAKILHRLPEARLVLKFKGWNIGSVARRFTEMFVAHAIEPQRIELLGSSPHGEFLAAYDQIDLALDPFPYSGGLTTCEAMWMGVPVVTFPGETFAGRHSFSHLSNVGLTETIARNVDEYVELAGSLASNVPRLSELRAGLRQQMAASPLCDAKRFTANLAAVLHGVWEQRSS